MRARAGASRGQFMAQQRAIETHPLAAVDSPAATAPATRRGPA
jgi:hypothetical protein